MPLKIYTPEQIIRKLREAEVLIAEVMTTRNAARQVGVTEQTYYRWRKEYGGMKVIQIVTKIYLIVYFYVSLNP